MSKCKWSAEKFSGSAWIPLHDAFLEFATKSDKAVMRRLLTVLEHMMKDNESRHFDSWAALIQEAAKQANGDLYNVYYESSDDWAVPLETTIQFSFEYWSNTMTDIHATGPVTITTCKWPLVIKGVFLQWR